MSEPPTELPEIFQQIKDGVPGAGERLFAIVYEDLHRAAAARMASERRHRKFQTLQTTALVHEVYLRLCKDRHQEWENRRHFFGAAMRAIRQILIDRARERESAKRGGGMVRVTLGDNLPDVDEPVEVLELDRVLSRLTVEYPDHAEVVRYRFYLGLTIPETADLLDVSERTINNRWQFAKAWLKRALDRGKPSDRDDHG